MSLRDRIKELRRVRASALRANPKNWRTHDQAQADALKGVLAEVGIVDAVLAREDADGVLHLIDGHLRAETAGDEELPVLILDVDEAEADKILLTLDSLTGMADVDAKRLADLLDQVETDDPGVSDLLEDLEGLARKKRGKRKKRIELKQEYSVLVRCRDELEQKGVLTELDQHGLEVRALIVDMPVKQRKKEPPPAPVLEEGEIEIARSVAIARSSRVIQLEGMFDVPAKSQAEEHWRVHVQLDRPWQVGLIVGPSGSGKSTLAKQLFGERLITGWDWPHDAALVDGFPEAMGTAEIAGLLSSVGFSSPPGWLKPYHVLSNGEQFRVTLARTLAERPELAVLDEFTSVVDRTVARIGSAAAAKAVREGGRRLVAVACHDDIEEWLQPDWVIQMPAGTLTWRSLRRRPEISLRIRRTSREVWEIFRRHHYLSHSLHPAAYCFLATVDGKPAAFTAALHQPHPTNSCWREHRTVCHPDFQGVGLGNAMSEWVAGVFAATGKPYRSVTSHPAMIVHRMRSRLWRLERPPSRGPDRVVGTQSQNRAVYRLTTAFQYVGPTIGDGSIHE